MNGTNSPAQTQRGSGRLWRDSLITGGAQLVADALGVATSLLLRALLGPAQMGVWQTLKMVLSYSNFASLGVSKGAAQELTVALGHGDLGAVRRNLDLAFSLNTLSSLTYGGLVALVGLSRGWSALGATDWSPSAWGRAMLADRWALGLVAIGFLALLQRHVTYQITVLRCRQRFDITAKLVMLEALATAIFGTSATWLWGFPGLLIGTSGLLMSTSAYLRVAGGQRFGWRFDSEEAGRLLRLGSPILVAGVLTSFYRSLDKWLILWLASDGAEALGLYSIALMVGTQVFGVGNTLAIAVAPRLGMCWGRTVDRRAVARLAAQSIALPSMITAGFVLAGMIVGPGLLSWLLPKYTRGMGALVCYLPGMWALALSMPLVHFINLVGRQRVLLLATATAMAIEGIAAGLWCSSGGSIAGVALLASTVHVGWLALVVRISIWTELDSSERAGFALPLAFGFGLQLLTALSAWYFTLASVSWRPTLALAIVVAGLWGAAAAWLWNRGVWTSGWMLEG